MQGIDKRIQSEISRIETYKKINRFPANWSYLGPLIENGLPNYNTFIFSWKGKDGNLAGGVYTARIVLQGDLRVNAPKVYMDDKFTHMHVYGHGLVCFPFIDQYKWKPSISIFDIATELEKMLDLPPDISSPANEKMKQLYEKNPQEYYDYLKDQATRFANNIPYQP
ncbi:ubiquitin-conjugating enzyme (macronuclear) [Tetrahymena thermophila SB210]|uniref:Ubiquitin-conjugating enzyme n=1 Tax=Tetrahymena thermophila (strain SB210) TaxID=312017 RepID=I7LWR4_TETTS|nr:ubiquitin-conjugating enzyme [Tetrahymena thermophila SB210]EAS02706.1 ubiquitin-conjugating enzyme [Tetrahymena thermophila SB210]|eukprot:XP_001022951.1 ubiquitin-conjugating enzyme [Tetrahymena thermophila SB210]